jgi:hypothetical protein
LVRLRGVEFFKFLERVEGLDDDEAGLTHMDGENVVVPTKRRFAGGDAEGCEQLAKLRGARRRVEHVEQLAARVSRATAP